MKRRTPLRTTKVPARKVACTVSAAALMLGVSQAATIGLHFQENYCNGSGAPAAGYSGYPVTLTAFGIPTNGWQNLTAMNTGYSGCSGPLGYSFSEVIDTNSASGGLNPLPNGSLSVSWFGPTANFSNFGGYAAGGPHYNYGGGFPSSFQVTGESEIYATFLRDGVNFGPPGGADNNQPGYSVDITGLKSLFTNSPFVVELMASSDSMQVLTNALVIDAVANSTQSVSYPYTPPVANSGGAPWVRGSGGGLSAGTASLNTDHIKIMSDHPQHGTSGGPNGFDNAGTISGFIITDKPVVSMAPQSAFACPGDTVQLSAYAVGVPPLSYQWRRNGLPIPGATGTTNTLVIPSGAASAPYAGNYDLVVTNLYGRATSAVAVVALDAIAITRGSNYVVDSNPKGPEHDGLDFGATWVASSTDARGKTRTGLMNFDDEDPDQITVQGVTNFDSPTGTVMFWMRTPGPTNLSGLPSTLFDRLSGTVAHGGSNGLTVAEDFGGHIQITTGPNPVTWGSVGLVNDTNWHLIVLTYDQTASGQFNLYIDGALDTSLPNSYAWGWQTGQEIELGLSHDTGAYAPYSGLLDDVRLYSRILTSTEVASIYSSNALVDTNTLVLQLNFNSPPVEGMTLSWQCTDAVLQSANSITGPWTDVATVGSVYSFATQRAVKFYRYHGHTPVTKITNPFLM